MIDKLSSSKSAYLLAMEDEFEKATGLKFSNANLEKVRKAFELDEDKAAAAMLGDADMVVAIRKNDNGTYTLIPESF